MVKYFIFHWDMIPNEFLKYNEAWTLLTRGFIWALR